MFKYSAYWRTWSRVLHRDGNGEWIELNLTHVNGDWSAVENETIRIHRTTPATGDSVQSTLPSLVQQAMAAKLGLELTQRLITADYMARLSRDKYEVYCSNNTRGGGVPFAKIDKLSLEI